jgi:hypothetical protein
MNTQHHPWLTVTKEDNNIIARDFQGREETFRVYEAFGKLFKFMMDIPRRVSPKGSVQQMAANQPPEDPAVRVLHFDTEPRSNEKSTYWYIQHRDKFCFYKGTSHTTEPHYKEAVETEIRSMADLIFFRLTTDFPSITPELINGAWE